MSSMNDRHAYSCSIYCCSRISHPIFLNNRAHAFPWLWNNRRSQYIFSRWSVNGDHHRSWHFHVIIISFFSNPSRYLLIFAMATNNNTFSVCLYEEVDSWFAACDRSTNHSIIKLERILKLSSVIHKFLYFFLRCYSTILEMMIAEYKKGERSSQGLTREAGEQLSYSEICSTLNFEISLWRHPNPQHCQTHL